MGVERRLDQGSLNEALPSANAAGAQPQNGALLSPAANEPNGDLTGSLGACVLVVDDEHVVARSTGRLLTAHGFRVMLAFDGRDAIEKARANAFDAIVSDIQMPDGDGNALLRSIRAFDADVPFVFLTGKPDLDSAIAAVRHGAFRYLLKPASADELLETVTQATRSGSGVHQRRDAEHARRASGHRPGLGAQFISAMDGLWIAMQPIVAWGERQTLGYEALVRSDETSLRAPSDLIEAAEWLGMTHELGRAIRRRISLLIPEAPPAALIFVNLHPRDLEDPELSADNGTLAPFADRVVFEITERAALGGIDAVSPRIAGLRKRGFRIAIDDLGAGYAGLSWFASLEPDVVKIDMSLVRGIDDSVVRRKLVSSVQRLCVELGIRMIAEGVETAEERDCLAMLGCDTFQGYLFGHPERGFQNPRF